MKINEDLGLGAHHELPLLHREQGAAICTSVQHILLIAEKLLQLVSI
jgi:hypothetical protein